MVNPVLKINQQLHSHFIFVLYASCLKLNSLHIHIMLCINNIKQIPLVVQDQVTQYAGTQVCGFVNEMMKPTTTEHLKIICWCFFCHLYLLNKY